MCCLMGEEHTTALFFSLGCSKTKTKKETRDNTIGKKR